MRLFKLLIISWLAVWLSACAVTSVFIPYPNQANTYQAAITTGVLDKANKKLDKKVGSKDGLLYRMERGRIRQLSDDYAGSKEDFIEAITAFDGQDLEATVTSRKAASSALSLLSNDNAMPYRGYGYERTFLHNFQVFNYLAEGDVEGATVELRKAQLEQRVMEEAHEKEIA